MRTTTLMKTALAVGGLAAALSLSACDGVTINFGEDEGQTETTDPGRTPDAEPTDTTETVDNGGDSGGSAGGGDSSGDSSAGSGGDTSGSAGSGSGSDTSGGDTSQQNAGFTLDENGNGKIPEAMLEEDLKQAYKDQGTAVDSVDCFSDMHVYNKSGSQTCDVVVAGKEYYGVVKVTDVVGQNVYYELEFAGIDF